MVDMDNITTMASPPDVKDDKVNKYLLYIFEGIAFLLLNLAVCVPIVRQKGLRLRNDYVIVAGLTFADAMNGLAYIFGGIYRVLTLLDGNESEKVSRFVCWWRPEHLLWGVFGTAAVILLCVLSFDRLAMVAVPYTYFAVTQPFGAIAVALAYGVGVIEMIWSYIMVHQEGPHPPNKHPKQLCTTSSAQPPIHYDLHLYGMTALSTLSVLVYLVVIILYRRKRNQQVSSHQQESEGELARQKAQRRMLITMAISELLTCVLYVLPTLTINVLQTFIDKADCEVCRDIQVYLWLTLNLNRMKNFFVFYGRHKELRQAFVATVKNKSLPENLQHWN